MTGKMSNLQTSDIMQTLQMYNEVNSRESVLFEEGISLPEKIRKKIISILIGIKDDKENV